MIERTYSIPFGVITECSNQEWGECCECNWYDECLLKDSRFPGIIPLLKNKLKERKNKMKAFKILAILLTLLLVAGLIFGCDIYEPEPIPHPETIILRCVGNTTQSTYEVSKVTVTQETISFVDTNGNIYSFSLSNFEYSEITPKIK